MSRRVGDVFYIEKEKEDKCEYCGHIAELRPYGENGAKICITCALENFSTTREMFLKRIEGVTKFVRNDDVVVRDGDNNKIMGE